MLRLAEGRGVMADVIQIEKGCDPWQPSHDAILAAQHRYYEIPLEGIIEQHGVRYSFICVGQGENVSFWQYEYVTPADEAALATMTSEELAAREITAPMVVAIALEGLGIVGSVIVDEPSDEAIERGYRQLASEMERLAGDARDLLPA